MSPGRESPGVRPPPGAFTCKTEENRHQPCRFDEIDTLLVFDDVLVPWEDVLFYRHTRAASFIRATLHRYSAYAFVLRSDRAG